MRGARGKRMRGARGKRGYMAGGKRMRGARGKRMRGARGMREENERGTGQEWYIHPERVDKGKGTLDNFPEGGDVVQHYRGNAQIPWVARTTSPPIYDVGHKGRRRELLRKVRGRALLFGVQFSESNAQV
ncbi:hypothetical protein Pcinc_027020 [Petrolisthes cinctipes]|uniref:Uncharacterized protein n=1 Tax=Petrolisthes cinctipes TaxID=88211 RepID=A0AAE1F5C7_PETCI|nr:hypothetical protein Pcinc_027020 [Petrolisthes cinctipes]